MPKVIISEVMPNPKGTDSGNEWIELFNSTSQNIDLSGWIIKSGTKPIDLSEKTIESKSFLIIENLKIAIKNSDNEISLIDPSGNIIDKISYKTAKEGQSLSLVAIKSANETKTNHLWDTPTKNLPNKILYEIEGAVEQEPTIGDEFYFTMKDPNNNLNTINFSEDFQFELMENTLRPSAKIVILAEKNTNGYTLKNYEVLGSPEAETLPIQVSEPQKAGNWELFLLIPIFALVIILVLLNKSTPFVSSHCKQNEHNPLSLIRRKGQNKFPL